MIRHCSTLALVGLAVAAGCGAREAMSVGTPPEVPSRTDVPEASTEASAETTAFSSDSAASPVARRREEAPIETSACPSDMVLVAGDYCPEVREKCQRWLDPPPYQFYRCAVYEEPSVCVSKRVRERFCIDREEYVRPGDDLPLAHQSWTSAEEICKISGKRLCKESEWQFACEGEEMRPYPYGFERDSTACNIDQMHLGKPQSGLSDLRAPTSAYPRCVSPFGVHDMSGNVEEWATKDDGKAKDRSTMKGAWWLPGKNTCRAATLGHGEVYEGPQTGLRCCADAP